MSKKTKRRKPGSNKWLIPSARKFSADIVGPPDEPHLMLAVKILEEVRDSVPILLRELRRLSDPEDFDSDGLVRPDAEVCAGAYAVMHTLHRLELVSSWIDDMYRTAAYEAAPYVAAYYSDTMDSVAKFVEVEGLRERFERPAYGEGDGHEG